MAFKYVESEKTAKIKVIGVGGAGGNAINNMIASNLQGVRFIVANTDAQSLDINLAPVKIQLGERLTEGLGAGANPDIGRDAAMENRDAIRSALEGSHMVFITAGFGGGTGTGAAPVIAEICKEIEALTVAVVTRPFSFEGKRRLLVAEKGIEELKKVADTVIIIPNDRLRGVAQKNAKLTDMFKRADEILLNSVKGITDLIMMPGLVNLDFADVKTTMSQSGMAIMGIGVASGDNRATVAAEQAIYHPLLEDISIVGAKAVLMNITCNSELTMDEAMEASERIYKEVGDEAEIIWGTAIDDSLTDELRVTVIATGIGDKTVRAATPKVEMVKVSETTHGGKLRVASQDDMRRIPDYDDPVFNDIMEPISAVGNASRSRKGGFNAFRGGIDFDDQDLDVPTFLRRKAD